MVCSVRRKLVLFLTLFIFSFTFSEGKAPKPFTVDKTEGANYRHLERHKCPDSCSHHGVCINNGSNSYCQCDDGWGGVACADVRYDLVPDEPISITIRKGQTVYCNITTRDPPFNNLTVYLQSFSKLSSIATPALYVGRDYYPDQDKNEYNDISTNRQKSLTVLNPTFGNWYIALTSRDSSPLVLTIQVNMDDVCFSNCSSNGKCQPPDDQGYVKCLCNYGHQGEYCEEYLPVMRNATPYTGYVDEGFWNYWHFNITVEPKRGMFLLLSVGGMDEQELPELYTQINGRPTASQYVCHRPNVSSSTGLTERVSVSNLTCIVNDISMLGKGNAWYIGVLGTKLSEESISNYTVSASFHLSEASQSLPSPLPSSPPRLLEKNIINRKWKQRSVL